MKPASATHPNRQSSGGLRYCATPHGQLSSGCRGAVRLFVLPFDRAANRRLLVSRRQTGGRNRAHGLDKLSGRALARRSCAAFVASAAWFWFGAGGLNKKTGGTKRRP